MLSNREQRGWNTVDSVCILGRSRGWTVARFTRGWLGRQIDHGFLAHAHRRDITYYRVGFSHGDFNYSHLRNQLIITQVASSTSTPNCRPSSKFKYHRVSRCLQS